MYVNQTTKLEEITTLFFFRFEITTISVNILFTHSNCVVILIKRKVCEMRHLIKELELVI